MEDLSQMLFKRQCSIHLWGNPDNKFVLHPRKEYDFFVIAIGRNFRKKILTMSMERHWNRLMILTVLPFNLNHCMIPRYYNSDRKQNISAVYLQCDGGEHSESHLFVLSKWDYHIIFHCIFVCRTFSVFWW